MLIPAALRYALILAGLALVGLAIELFRRRVRRRPRLPEASVAAGRSISWRSALVRWMPAAALPAGLAASYWGCIHSTECLVVREFDAVWRYGVGAPDVPMPPGFVPYDTDDARTVWVVNRSSRSVRIERFQYGGLGYGRRTLAIPPGTGAPIVGIDHVGPHDRPPKPVADETGFEVRHWLTW